MTYLTNDKKSSFKFPVTLKKKSFFTVIPGDCCLRTLAVRDHIAGLSCVELGDQTPDFQEGGGGVSSAQGLAGCLLTLVHQLS